MIESFLLSFKGLFLPTLKAFAVKFCPIVVGYGFLALFQHHNQKKKEKRDFLKKVAELLHDVRNQLCDVISNRYPVTDYSRFDRLSENIKREAEFTSVHCMQSDTLGRDLLVIASGIDGFLRQPNDVELKYQLDAIVSEVLNDVKLLIK